jgi:hypothetical protein
MRCISPVVLGKEAKKITDELILNDQLWLNNIFFLAIHIIAENGLVICGINMQTFLSKQVEAHVVAEMWIMETSILGHLIKVHASHDLFPHHTHPTHSATTNTCSSWNQHDLSISIISHMGPHSQPWVLSLPPPSTFMAS